MTPSELYEELRKQGHYVLLFTTVDEVKQLLHEVTDDEIKQGLEWLYCNYADHEDFDSVVELVQHRIVTNRERA